VVYATPNTKVSLGFRRFCFAVELGDCKGAGVKHKEGTNSEEVAAKACKSKAK
jgi:hypothetical protein